MAESWATFVHKFNKHSWYSTKVFSVLKFQFEWISSRFVLLFTQKLQLPIIDALFIGNGREKSTVMRMLILALLFRSHIS